MLFKMTLHDTHKYQDFEYDNRWLNYDETEQFRNFLICRLKIPYISGDIHKFWNLVFTFLLIYLMR